MIKKRLLAISITMALALGLIGCSKKESVAPEETNTVETGEIEEQKEWKLQEVDVTGTKIICRRTSYPGGVNPDKERQKKRHYRRLIWN